MIRVQIKKKAIVPVIVISLILMVTVVSFISLNGWFTNFQNDLYYKQIQGEKFNVNKIKILAIKYDNSIPTLYVRNSESKNFILTMIKLNSYECLLNGGNVILANSMTRIYLNCPNSVIKNLNDVLLVTTKDVLSNSVMLDN